MEMMKELMHTEDVAIYNIVNEDYARMFSASSVKSRSLGNSIRYKEMEAVYNELKEQKVYINKSMDERYPLMANAIFEGGQMKMLIFSVGAWMGTHDSWTGKLSCGCQLSDPECSTSSKKIYECAGREAIFEKIKNP